MKRATPDSQPILGSGMSELLDNISAIKDKEHETTGVDPSLRIPLSVFNWGSRGKNARSKRWRMMLIMTYVLGSREARIGVGSDELTLAPERMKVQDRRSALRWH